MTGQAQILLTAFYELFPGFAMKPEPVEVAEDSELEKVEKR